MQFMAAPQHRVENSLIYYFSKYRLFDTNIINDLLFCKTFRVSVVQQLGPQWQQSASIAVYVTEQAGKKFVSYPFMVDTFVFAWIQLLNSTPLEQLNDQNVPIFASIVRDKLRSFKSNDELLSGLIEGFYILAHELSLEIVRSHDAANEISSQDEVQPLLVMRDRTRSAQRDEGSRKRIKKRNSMSSPQEGTSEMSLSALVEEMTLEDLPERRQESERSQSDMRDCDVVGEHIKARKFTKQQEKLQQSLMFQNLPEPDNKIKQQWQVAKQHVVCIWQIPLENGNSLRKESIRFIQPSEFFYKQIMQLWMLEKCSSHRKICFNQFIYKAKHFFGLAWNETYLIPTFVAFQALEQTLQNVPANSSQIQILKYVIYDLVEKMRTLWSQNIILNAQKINSK